MRSALFRCALVVSVGVLASACATDVDDPVDIDEAPIVAESEWRSATPGCERVRSDVPVFLAVAEREPSLGALVDARGHALCADSLSLLLREADLGSVPPARWDVTPVRLSAVDPDPQPAIGHRADPDPQPAIGSMIRTDPDPQPAVDPARKGDEDPDPVLPSRRDLGRYFY